MGISVGLVLAAAVLAALLLPGQERWSAPGTMNAGHEGLSCDGCHRTAPGTLRQQLQANARYVLGLRATPADFGRKPVGNGDCLACHERPFDRHPVSRFSEPRFAAARRALDVEQCEGCHREHSGARVTVGADYCVHCHQDLKLDRDPLDVPHATLVASARWETCLGCHDFHGNHVMRVPTLMSLVSAPGAVERYLAGGPSPYPAERRRAAAREREGGSDE